MLPEHLLQLEMLVGSGLQALLSSRKATEECLDNSDSKMRYAAIMLMTHHWGPTEQFKNKCEEMAIRDTDSTVRSAALGCLGFCFATTDNQRVEQLLATIVCDESESYETRRSAYIALFIVNRLGSEHIPPGELLANLRIPTDVDWKFVQSRLHSE
jgi:hypothetical protein